MINIIKEELIENIPVFEFKNLTPQEQIDKMKEWIKHNDLSPIMYNVFQNEIKNLEKSLFN